MTEVSNSPILQSMISGNSQEKSSASNSNNIQTPAQNNEYKPLPQQNNEPETDAFVKNKNKGKAPKALKRLGIGGGIGAGIGALGGLGYSKLLTKSLSMTSKMGLDSVVATAMENLVNDTDILGNPDEFVKACAKEGINVVAEDGKVKIAEDAAKQMLESTKECIKKTKTKTVLVAAGIFGAVGLGIGAIVHLVKSHNEKKAENNKQN